MATEADSTPSLNSLTNANYLKQKRARSQLSCIPCRSGKLKCNRSHYPACDQCIKRNREGQCVYIPPPPKQKPAQNVKGRIRQLESLVVELMHTQTQIKNASSGATKESAEEDEHSTGHGSSQGQKSPPSQFTPPSDNDTSPLESEPTAQSVTTPADIDEAIKPFGQMNISKNGISYTGESHWQTILNSISELKRDLGDDDDAADDDEAEIEGRPAQSAVWGHAPLNGNAPFAMQMPNFDAASGMGFMLHRATPTTKDELIAAVPEKKVADRLLSLWFNSPDPFKVMIHAPTFQLQYREFWRNPKSTPTMWLGLFFAILSLASSFGLRDLDLTAPAAQNIVVEVTKYHSLAASAAILGEFTRPKPYTVECLLLYAAALRSNDAFVNVWLMIGLVIRLSLRMGYHRDPSNYPQIKPFDGEMRRRTWAIISMIDVLISFQLGLPSMVKTLQSDTQPPRNILDRDFHRDSISLPPNRGIDELTPCSYVRAKLGLTRIFADATELSHATIAPAYEEMMKLDEKLERAKLLIPPLLQMPDISEIVADPAEQLMCRFNLDLLYLKVKIIIHRRYMQKPFASLTPHEQEMGIGKSRKLCVDAALRVMQHHNTIYNASQAGGQLDSVKWYMGSISTHDFLLAAMVVCLELSQQINNNPAVNPSGRLCPQRAAMMDALEKSQKIWSDASGRRRTPAQFVGTHDKIRAEHMFDETERASKAMGVMLKKVKASFPAQAQALENTRDSDSWTSASRPEQESTAAARLQNFRPFSYLHGTQANSNHFTGVHNNQGWDHMSGVPEDVFDPGNGFNGNTNGGAPPALYHEDYPQSSSNNTSPEDSFPQRDYSMLGNMLDLQGNLDWQMLDDALHPGEHHKSPWPSNSPSAGVDAPTIKGLGSGLGRGLSPATLPNAAAGGSLPSGDVYPGSWMSIPDMENVDFDVDNIMDYTDTSTSFNNSYQWPRNAA